MVKCYFMVEHLFQIGAYALNNNAELVHLFLLISRVNHVIKCRDEAVFLFKTKLTLNFVQFFHNHDFSHEFDGVILGIGMVLENLDSNDPASVFTFGL